MTRVAVALLIVLTACGGGLTGIDPDAPNIRPGFVANPAMIVTAADEGTMPPGVEGGVLFVRLIDLRGGTILDRPFEWDADRQTIPSGRYAMTVYYRVCDANCGNLDDESPICSADVTVAPGDRIDVHVTGRSLEPGTGCTISGP